MIDRFTGSNATGRRIVSILGQRRARYTLELCGKSAAIICEDYDIETAAATLAERACDMTGQVCASLTRIIVPRSRYAAMTEALAAAFSKVKVGDPFAVDPNGPFGELAATRSSRKLYSAGEGRWLRTSNRRRSPGTWIAGF